MKKQESRLFRKLNLVLGIFSILLLALSQTRVSAQAQAPTPPPTLISTRCSAYTAPVVPAPLRTFYINADNGNDSNDGLTSATAWRTLSRANNSAQAGDLFLLRGVFYNQWINPNTSGTSANKITYRKESGQIAVLDTGLYDGGAALGGKSHIVVDGLEIRNIAESVQVTDGGSYNWLRNLYIHNGGHVTFRYGANNNRLEDSVLVDIGVDQSNAGDAVDLLNDADNNIVVRNYFGNAGHGAYDILLQGDSTGYNDNNIFAQNIVDNQWSSNVLIGGRAVGTTVECNIIKNATQTSTYNYPRAGIYLSGDSNTVRYNYIYNNKSHGIVVEGYVFGGQPQYPENNSFYHNTVVGNGGAGLNIVVHDTAPEQNGYVRNNTFENNIFWNNLGYDGANGQNYDIIVDFYQSNNPWTTGFTDGNIFRYNNTSNLPFFVVIRNSSRGGNLFYDTPQAAQATIPSWTNNTRLDPLFTNPLANNYSLQLNSPMIDTGRIIPGVVYNGSAPDKGASETAGVQPTQNSYPGPNAPNIPATIEVENFDNGGEGAAYHESYGNTSSGVYRSNPIEAVDILANSTASNGYAVFEASAGEWLKYTINASNAGTYNINVRYASQFNNGGFHLEIDGVNVTGQMTANSTGGWSIFQTISKTGVSISAGQHIVRLVFDTNSPNGCGCVVANFDSITFQSASNSVIWQNIQGTTSTNGSVQHSGTDYSGMAKSQQTLLTSGFFEWTYNGYQDVWVGIGNNDEQPNTGYNDMPYSFSGSVREFGVYKSDGNPVAGDRLRIEINVSKVVSFKKNGQLIYTSQTPASGSYYLVFKSQGVAGYGISNATFGGN